jgi:signal transduction histidine kinase
MNPTKKSLRTFLMLGLLGPAQSVVLQASDAPQEPLPDAATVLSLSAREAGQRLKVAVTGVVTAAELDWKGQFFLQDSTGGVFVENLGHGVSIPAPGDLVTVTGVSHPGAFAPIISEPHWQKIGTAPLPEAKQVLIENLVSGIEDGLRVEISGVVRAATLDDSLLNVVLAVGGYRLQVRVRPPKDVTPESLLAARVRVRGTTATHYNAALRHLTSVAVYVTTPEDFIVLEPGVANPFVQEVVPLNNVAQYRRGSGSAKRVHVLGTVTHQRIGEDIFLQDGSGGIRIQSAQLEAFTPGDQVEAAGFLEYEGYLPLLRDATLRRTGPRGVPVPPRSVPAQEIRSGLHHADLITMRGKIVDRAVLPVSRQTFSGVNTTWLVQGDGLGFTVEREERDQNAALAAIPIGSVVAVDGVCLCEIDADGKFKTLKLLLTSPAGLRVLVKPSWLTPERLLLGLGLLSVVLVAVAVWSLTVSKKNAALSFMIRELEKAQHGLQEAHDTLEQKVIERSAQLQTEMTARRTAEVQFRAVLTERTRLARDLHDTLEQTLTGIGFQLDAVAKLFVRNPEGSSQHLQLARNWLRQSQVGLRRSIWDLRSRELEQFDLASALRRSAEQLVDGTEIQLEFMTDGEKRSLPEVVEENVLRIGQEALTNVAKHAHATRVKIMLEFGACTLRLVVEDNGVGFEHGQTPVPGDNHFGLLGMSERAKRLAGHIIFESRRGRGTSIVAEIPLETNDEPDTPNTFHEKVARHE